MLVRISIWSGNGAPPVPAKRREARGAHWRRHPEPDGLDVIRGCACVPSLRLMSDAPAVRKTPAVPIGFSFTYRLCCGGGRALIVNA